MAVQSARARHKQPSHACLNNLCYLNQYLPVNYQPEWKQGSCDPQQRKVNLLGEEAVSANEGSCKLLGEGFIGAACPLPVTISHPVHPEQGCSPTGPALQRWPN